MTENERKQTVVINRDWCKGCGICVAFCPKQALILDDEGKASWVLAREMRPLRPLSLAVS